MTLALVLIGSYFLGAIPFAWLIAKYWKGIDICSQGSCNPGATNMFRVVGKTAGWATLILDVLKGMAAVVLAKTFFPDNLGIAAVAGICAIAGHTWTCFLRFRGGKGVATSAGVFLALTPGAGIVTIAIFLAGYGLSKHVSVGSILAALSLPIAAYFLYEPGWLVALSAGVAGVVVWRHRENIQRLRRHGEF